MEQKPEPIPMRLRYYSEAVEPDAEYDDITADQLIQPDADHPANLCSSLCTDGRHRPALDIDIPCQYIPSSTPGHGHLYFPSVAMSWEKYRRLLDALVEAGIVDAAYRDHSVNSGQTLLRLPHVKKVSA